MSKSNEHATTKSSAIRCLEVMISKESLEKNAGLFWTLSVYSLENKPVAKTRTVVDSEVFHFMVFDWKRTIRNLLDNHQVSYSIIEYFSPVSVFSVSNDGAKEGVRDQDYFAAAATLHDAAAGFANSRFFRLPGLPEDNLILEHENGY